jgi:hypothetical protein
MLIPIALVVWLYIDGKKQEQRIREHGKRVIGWIVQANPELYRVGSMDRPAQILVAFDAEPNPPDDFMEELAKRAASLKEDEEPTSESEEAVADLVKDERYRPFQRFLLPKDFASRRKVYSMHVWVKRKYLSGSKLLHPFVRCYVIEDDDKSRPLMAEYEPGDKKFRNTHKLES